MIHSISHTAERSRLDTDYNECPFSIARSNGCAASLSAITVQPHIEHSYCHSENHDNCPLFLSKVLRKTG